MELYYLLVQRSLWTIQLIILFLIPTESRHFYRRTFDRRQLRAGPPPVILPDAQNITVHRGERVVLECRVKNRWTKNVQWSLLNASHPLTIGDLTWTQDKHYSVVYTKHNDSFENWDLVIEDAQPKHSNTYECQISSIHTHRRLVYLTVLRTLRKISPEVSLQGTTLLDSRGTINLTCNATGSERAPESIDWFHEGIIIRPQNTRWNGRLQIKMRASRRSLISQLTIRKSTLKDQGSYICRSSDRETESIEVYVLEDENPPSRPIRNNMSDEPAKSNKAAFLTVNILVFTVAFPFSLR